MTGTSTLQIECVETLAGVEALEAEWMALEQATPEATGFQSFRWCRTWLSIGGAIAPRVICVREGGLLVMLWPLQIERRFGVAIARWIGEPMTQYGDALARAGEGRARWRKAAEAAMARWRDVDLLALTRLRADGVAGAGAAQGERLSAPYINLRAGKPRRHKSLERRAKRLEAAGPVVLTEAQTGADREALTRRAFALKRAWLSGKGIFSAGLSNAASEDFVAALAREGFLRVHALRVGGEIAAIDLGFVGGGAYRSLLGCYNARFAEGSPGQTLTGRLIARCAEEGLSTFDLLLPADAFKLAWASGETSVHARFQPLSLKGRFAGFALARLRPLAKRVAHALGPLRARFKPAAFSSAANSANLSAQRREGTAS